MDLGLNGKIVLVEEVARVVAFVSSLAASFLSGANIRADGALVTQYANLKF